MTPLEQETDSFDALEERIQQAVQLVTQLRHERDAALAQASEAKSEAERLASELKTLHAERKQVRTRIERLLGQIDQLSSS